MRQGFVPGQPIHGLDNSFICQWIEGAPVYSFWAGLKGISDGQQIPIATYRCVKCGFLESYARSEFAQK